MIVAIGGGELHVGRVNPIDDFIVHATGKASPRLLFLPTASRDAPGYCEKVQSYFEAGWGCEVRSLLLSKSPSPRSVSEAVAWADLVYAGGGDTLYLMKTWVRYGLKAVFQKALNRGAVLSGISAGAICWFEGGIGAYNGYRPLPGLGLIPGRFLPHFEPGDSSALASYFEREKGSQVLAVEDRAAVTWDGCEFRVVRDGPEVGGWIVDSQGARPV